MPRRYAAQAADHPLKTHVVTPLPNLPAVESWWAEPMDRPAFHARVYRELPRMQRSRFGAEAHVTVNGRLDLDFVPFQRTGGIGRLGLSLR